MNEPSLLGAFAKALAAAQSEMQDAKKDATNPHFKNRYATLASVRDAITKPLAKHGLAVTQTFEPHGDTGVCIVTTLLHEGGGAVTSKLFVPVQKKDAQGFGSAISYGRRYSLAAIVGIAADDDDDGEASAARGTNGTHEKADSSPKAVAAASREVSPVEVELSGMYAHATDTTAVAKADALALKYIQAKKLSPVGRERLLRLRAESVERLRPDASGAA